MKTLESLIGDAKRIALVGHTNPDGDCLGSLSAVWRYLKDNAPEKEVTVYAGAVPAYLGFLFSDVPYETGDGEGRNYDLAVSLDASSETRIGAGLQAFKEAPRTLVIDHHETNPGFGGVNHIEPKTSSTAEVLTVLMDPAKISRSTAEKLYTGIIQDTGVFRYSCTSVRTLQTAGMLLEKGIDFAKIVETSVIDQPYREMRIRSRVVEDSRLFPEEKFIYGIAPLTLQKEYGVTSPELGTVVVELNAVKEANVALFLYQHEDGTWKGSLRAKCDVNLAMIAAEFGGGGHARAAGFSFEKDPERTAEEVRRILRERRNV